MSSDVLLITIFLFFLSFLKQRKYIESIAFEPWTFECIDWKIRMMPIYFDFNWGKFESPVREVTHKSRNGKSQKISWKLKGKQERKILAKMSFVLYSNITIINF